MGEFTNQSVGVMSWVETLEVPRLPDGRAEVESAFRSSTRGGVGGGELAQRSMSSRTNSRFHEAVEPRR
jgi:hypothetical protein